MKVVYILTISHTTQLEHCQVHVGRGAKNSLYNSDADDKKCSFGEEGIFCHAYNEGENKANYFREQLPPCSGSWLKV